MRTRKKEQNFADATLGQLCNFVVTSLVAWEDVEECIEIKAVEACYKGHRDQAVHQIEHLALFYEQMEYKSEEQVEDQNEIYLLLAEMYRCTRFYEKSLHWLHKAAAVKDTHAPTFGNLAAVYEALGDLDHAIAACEKEIALSPGSFFAYLIRAELLKKKGLFAEMEQCLKELLQRDPDNIQALHHLIRHYEERNPRVNVQLLRRRIINTSKRLAKIDLAAWVYHMCAEHLSDRALARLDACERQELMDPLVLLLKAWIYGRTSRPDRRGEAIRRFVDMSRDLPGHMEYKLLECSVVLNADDMALLRQEIVRYQNG